MCLVCPRLSVQSSEHRQSGQGLCRKPMSVYKVMLIELKVRGEAGWPSMFLTLERQPWQLEKKNLLCVLQKSSCVNLTSNLVTTVSITGVFLISTPVIVIAPVPSWSYSSCNSICLYICPYFDTRRHVCTLSDAFLPSWSVLQNLLRELSPYLLSITPQHRHTTSLDNAFTPFQASLGFFPIYAPPYSLLMLVC